MDDLLFHSRATSELHRQGSLLTAFDETTLHRVAMLGNHLPRQCGIATFTTDLSAAIAAAAPDLDCFVLAMNDGRHKHAYPGRVRFELTDTDIGAYTRAADFLNVNAVDVLSVQHEYGIFGGKAGSPSADDAARAAHAGRDDAAHHSRRAESSSASRDGRAHLDLRSPGRDDGARCGASP